MKTEKTETESEIARTTTGKYDEPASVISELRLRNYEDIKFKLAGLVREANAEAWKEKNTALQREFQLTVKRLAEDRFYLTIAGQFSRGKTTLMNAILGMDRLPTGIVPVTSVITAVSYNTRERVVLRFRNSNLSHEASLTELPEWITERGNPGNQRKIDMAEVQLPAEILRRGAFFVDTPGLGSAVLENTTTTRRFLPQVDALVLVTSFEFPLSNEELEFLRAVRSQRRRVFIVVNKVDLCSPDQRAEVLGFIKSRLADQTDLTGIPLFAVSASEALAAKLEHNHEQLQRSGLPAFERALVEYLIRFKSSDFLAGMCDRIESLMVSLTPSIQEQLIIRLWEIRKEAFGEELDEHERVGIAVDNQAVARISSCFICKRMADATFKFMSGFQFDLSHSQAEQGFHASRTGFCSLHSREYARLASPQGIASGYPRTILQASENLNDLLHDGHLRADWEDRFREFLPGTDKCRACHVVAQAEEEIINDFLRDQDDAATSADLPSVCLVHLLRIVQRVRATPLANRMIQHSAAVLERVSESLQRFALRHGGLHMEMVTEEESQSPEHALNLLVGQPNVRPSLTAPDGK